MPKKHKLDDLNNWWIAYFIFVLLLFFSEGYSDRTIGWVLLGLAIAIGIKTYEYDVFLNKKNHNVPAKVVSVFTIALLLFLMGILYYRLSA